MLILLLGIDAFHFAANHRFNPLLTKNFLRVDEDVFPGIFPGQKTLRKRRTLVRKGAVRGNDGKFARFKPQLDKMLRSVTRHHSAAKYRVLHISPDSSCAKNCLATRSIS